MRRAATVRARRSVPMPSNIGISRPVPVEPDGSAIYLAGSNQGGPQPGVVVRKFDANGNDVWGVRLSPTGFDTAGGLLLTATGELILASTRIDGGTGTSDAALQSIDRTS